MGKRRLAIFVGLLVIAGSYVVTVRDPAALEFLRLKTFDLYQRLAPREPRAFPVVVVDIDEASLAAYGQWPWPRALLAQLVDRIGEAGASVIALDIVFPERDRMGQENDDALAAALGRHPTVLARFAATGDEDMNLPAPRSKSNLAFVDVGDRSQARDQRDFLPPLRGVVTSLQAFEDAARGAGIAAYDVDDDGIARHLPTLYRTPDGAIHPGLALEALRVGLGTTVIRATWDAARGFRTVGAPPVAFAVDATARVWPHFARWDDARRERTYVSAKDVIEGRLEAARLRGAFVLVGTTAPGLFDSAASPVDAVIPGVDIHAQALEGMLDAAARQADPQRRTGPPALLVRPPVAQGLESLAVAAAGLVLLIVVLVVPPVWTLPAAVALVAGLLGGGWALFALWGLLLSPIYAAVATILLYAILMYLASVSRGSRAGAVDVGGSTT